MIEGAIDRNTEILTLNPDQADFLERMKAKSKKELEESISRRQELQIARIEKGRPSETLAWELSILKKVQQGKTITAVEAKKNAEATSMNPDQIDFLKRMKTKSPDELALSVARRKKIQAKLTKIGRPDKSLAWELAQLEKLQKGETLAGTNKGHEVTTSDSVPDKKNYPEIRQKQLFESTRTSRRLEKNKEAKLDPLTEIKEYLESQDPEYRKQIEVLSKQIPEPMDPHTKLVVSVPVAGHQESKTIYDTLRSFSSQDADPNSFEVLLFVNFPERMRESNGEAIKGTVAQIEKAKKDFPKLKVRVIRAAIADDQVRITNIRKIADDVAVARQMKAGIKRDITILSNDADNQGISPNYIRSHIEYFDANPDKDGAVGNLQFDPQAFVRFPIIQIEQELSTLLDQTGFRNGNVVMLGANSGVRSSMYAAMGGYPTARKTEQSWVGNTIRTLRGTKKALGYVPNALLTTSSRRKVSSYIQGGERISFGDEKKEQSMRTVDVNSLSMFKWDDKLEVDMMKKKIEAALGARINSYEKGEKLGKNSQFYKKSIERIGITYNVKGDPRSPDSTVEIVDMSKFVRRQCIMQKLINKGERNMATVLQASFAE